MAGFIEDFIMVTLERRIIHPNSEMRLRKSLVR